MVRGEGAGAGQPVAGRSGTIVSRIAEDPILWREREGGYRRVNCPVFPYFVAYIIRGQKVIVAAVGHGHRKPDYWKARVE